MKLHHAILAALAGLMPTSAAALGLEFPSGATLTTQTVQDIGSYEVPVGVFEAGRLPTVSAEGRVVSQAWRLANGAFSTLQIIKLLRDQLEAEGYEVIVQCDSEKCGGFDFRYQMDLLPEPEMHVDLGDFRYLSARRPDETGGDEYVSVIVSRGGPTAFIQLTQVDPGATETGAIVTSTMSVEPAGKQPDGQAQPIGTMLSTIGRATLDDLEFAVGSSELAGLGFSSLEELANWLKANPDMTIALVGHTDAQGALAANMALSKRRAASVRKRLIEEFGIPASRIEAQGVGYLVPIASNLTQEGRDKNRRVEVVLTSTR